MNAPVTNRRLALAWLTVAGAHPLDHIDAAAAAGFEAVGLRLIAPPNGGPMVPLVGDGPLVREVRGRLDATGVSVLDVETLWLDPAFDLAPVLPALEVAAHLGARHLLIMGNDPEPRRLADHLGSLCAAAADFGIAVGIEFAAYTHTPNLRAADALLAAAGDPANAGILLDALHFARSGGQPQDLAGLRPGRISYCQLGDTRGPAPAHPDALRAEARAARLLPGEGELPLAQLLRALPHELPLSIEAPTLQLSALPFGERARLAAAATRRLLGRIHDLSPRTP